jgi:hypothetical protein
MRQIVDPCLRPGLEHPVDLCQSAGRIWPVVQGECADCSVETRIGKRQRADVPGLEAHALAEICYLHPPGRTLNHLGRDVDAYRF